MSDQAKHELHKELVTGGDDTHLPPDLMTSEQAQEFMDDFTLPPVELDDELQWRLVETKMGMKMVQHPYVHTFYMGETHHRQLNKWFATKKQMLADYEKARNWHGIIFVVYERPYRLEALRLYAARMSDQEYWEAVGDVWTDTENAWQNKADWVRLFKADRPGRVEHLHTEPERLSYEALPDEVTVYRGIGAPGRTLGSGLSWTTHRIKAEWFARRFSPPNPRLVEGTVAKTNVLAHFLRRGEQEVVVALRDVKNRQTVKLPKPKEVSPE